jgi:hypothetical protein
VNAFVRQLRSVRNKMKHNCVTRNGLSNLLKVAATFGFTLLSVVAYGAGGGLTMGNPGVQKVAALQELVTSGLMAQPEILGTGIGEGENGTAELIVYVNSGAANQGEVVRSLPPTLRGIAVRSHLTEPFRAFGKPSRGGVSHTSKQSLPIQLGTSGGWGQDLANGYCCGGTLGSLVQANGVQYILSNYHVMESDIVLGGNNTVAADGQAVIQPGLIDVRCNAANAQTVATLKTLNSLPDNNVDVGVAEVMSDSVSGSILEIGQISSETVDASISQPVKKSGRTTGLTRSKVSALNATIRVTYENECAGGTAFTKTFTGQIVVSNARSSFLNSGDSGSLMVEDVATAPRAVGLLYAGSSTTAIANPIGEVLAFLSEKLGGTATMVGQ